MAGNLIKVAKQKFCYKYIYYHTPEMHTGAGTRGYPGGGPENLLWADAGECFKKQEMFFASIQTICKSKNHFKYFKN